MRPHLALPGRLAAVIPAWYAFSLWSVTFLEGGCISLVVKETWVPVVVCSEEGRTAVVSSCPFVAHSPQRKCLLLGER